MEEIKELGKKYLKDIQAIRRHLHENPETANEEVETQKYVMAQLDKLGIEYHKSMNTGIVGLIKGGKPGKTVLLRADMDALDIEEDLDLEYKSKVPGKMHACGHDGHTAGLLGAAMILNDIKDQLNGNVKLMFQPAEERFPGGAKGMIEEGILENPKVDAVFGVHLWGDTPKGVVHYKEGPMMAAPDSFEIDITGRGGHGAMPQQTIDPVVVAAQIVLEMQSIVSRKVDPLSPAVLSVTVSKSGEVFNVIPHTAYLAGTVRTFSENERSLIPKLMEDVLKGQELSNGITYDFKYTRVYPPLINDGAMTQLAKKAFGKIIGDENVQELPKPNMGGEDFSYLTEKVPGAYLFVGIGEEGKVGIHHHPQFEWDDEVLEHSAAGLAQVCYDYLNQ